MRSSWPALAGLALVACLTPTQPPPGADGRTIYTLQLCANCHGNQGEGQSQGPPLRGLRELWSREDLVEFLADPAPWQARDPRLARLAREHSGEMAGYSNLSAQERGRLADYLMDL